MIPKIQVSHFERFVEVLLLNFVNNFKGYLPFRDISEHKYSAVTTMETLR